MKIDVEELKGCERAIKVELSPEEVNRAFSESYKHLSSRTEIPGFRRGKVPRRILELRFGKRVRDDVAERAARNAYRKALKEKSINPITSPEVDLGGEVPTEGKPFSFKLHVVVRPKVKLDGYKGIKVEKETFKVTDKDVEKFLERKREEMAEFLPVEENRPIQKDDWVTVDYELPWKSQEGFLFRVGSETFPPPVEERLIGSRVGEEMEIEVHPPKDVGGEGFLCKLKVKGIKRRRLLVVNDEFARDLGGYGSLKELREDIRKKLELEVEERSEERLRERIIDTLVEMAEVEPPPVMVEREIGYLEAISQAVNPKRKEDQKKLREELKPLALKRTKVYLVLEEISEREGISVSDEELKGDEDRKYELKRRKVLDFLVENAQIEEKGEPLILTPERARLVTPPTEGLLIPGKNLRRQIDKEGCSCGIDCQV